MIDRTVRRTCGEIDMDATTEGACMSGFRTSTAIRRVFWATLLCSVPWLGSCDQLEDYLAQKCEQTEESYNRALEQETTALKSPDAFGEPDQRPPHFGLTLSNELISKFANTAIDPILEAVLEIASVVNIDGQSVDLSTDGDIVDLQLSADDTCNHCFAVTVDLGGRLVASIPSIGTRRANLDGVVKFVAPLVLDEGDEKSAAVKLDLRKFGEYGVETITPRIIDPKNNLSEDWRRRIRRALSDLLKRTLDKRLAEKATLVEFAGPSFGLDGFELTPVALRSDGDQGSVFAGFSANIEALNEESIEGVESVTELAEGQDIALSFQPELILHVLSLLMGGPDEEGAVARAYDRAGRAAENGSYRVILQTFGTGSDAAPEGPDAGGWEDAGFWGETGARGGNLGDASARDAGDASVTPAGPRPTPFGLGFSVYRYGSGGVCFSAGARALGGAGVRGGDFRIGIRDVRFTGDGVPERVLDIANWTTAQFVQKSTSLIRTSVEGKNLRVPGTDLGIGPLGIGLRPNTVILRGRSKTEQMDGDESG